MSLTDTNTYILKIHKILKNNPKNTNYTTVGKRRASSF